MCGRGTSQCRQEHTSRINGSPIRRQLLAIVSEARRRERGEHAAALDAQIAAEVAASERVA